MAEQQDHDLPWKDILDLLFEEFMVFFFPEAHAQIDWRAGHEFLDKELQRSPLTLSWAAASWTNWSGCGPGTGAAWVLVHVEVQRQPARFPEDVRLPLSRL